MSSQILLVGYQIRIYMLWSDMPQFQNKSHYYNADVNRCQFQVHYTALVSSRPAAFFLFMLEYTNSICLLQLQVL